MSRSSAMSRASQNPKAKTNPACANIGLEHMTTKKTHEHTHNYTTTIIFVNKKTTCVKVKENQQTKNTTIVAHENTLKKKKTQKQKKTQKKKKKKKTTPSTHPPAAISLPAPEALRGSEGLNDELQLTIVDPADSALVPRGAERLGEEWLESWRERREGKEKGVLWCFFFFLRFSFLWKEINQTDQGVGLFQVFAGVKST